MDGVNSWLVEKPCTHLRESDSLVSDLLYLVLVIILCQQYPPSMASILEVWNITYRSFGYSRSRPQSPNPPDELKHMTRWEEERLPSVLRECSLSSNWQMDVQILNCGRVCKRRHLSSSLLVRGCLRLAVLMESAKELVFDGGMILHNISSTVEKETNLYFAKIFGVDKFPKHDFF